MDIGAFEINLTTRKKLIALVLADTTFSGTGRFQEAGAEHVGTISAVFRSLLDERTISVQLANAATSGASRFH